MNVLFQGIRENARNFEYPAPSVAALESVLIRLYLESPMGGSKRISSASVGLAHYWSDVVNAG